MTTKQRVKFVIKHSVNGAVLVAMIGLMLMFCSTAFDTWLAMPGDWRATFFGGAVLLYSFVGIYMLYQWANEPD